LAERSERVGANLLALIRARLARFPKLGVRGSGLMLAVDLGPGAGRAAVVASRLLERGYITSTGGGQREVLVLTPPLTISEALLPAFVEALEASVGALGS
jgi:4-aminobutyrate aminotransferase-like enzyme